MLKRQKGEESKRSYAETLIISFPGWGSFLLTILFSLGSVCVYEDLLLLNGHFYLLLYLNFHPTVAPACSHVLISYFGEWKHF